MALKDCTFFVDVNGKQVEMDYDQFRSYLLDGTNLSALAPTLVTKKGTKVGFERAEAAPARAEAPKARAEAPTPSEMEVSSENLRKLMPKLSKARADAIIAVMKAMGIPFDRLKIAKGRVEGKLEAQSLTQEAYHATKGVFASEPGFPNGRFRLDKIGTGTGRALEGYGIYFAQIPRIAGKYYEKFIKSGNPAVLYKLDIPDSIIPKLFNRADPLPSQVFKQLADAAKSAGRAVQLNPEMTLAQLMKTLGENAAGAQLLESAGVLGAIIPQVSFRGTSNNYLIWSQSALDKIALLEANTLPLQQMQQGKETLQQADTQARDAEYMAAVKAGDTAKAQKMVEEAAKAAGYDITAYHGTRASKAEFDNIMRPSRIGALGPAIYFSPSKEGPAIYAGLDKGNGFIIEAYLKGKNLFQISHVNNSSEEYFQYFDPSGKLTDEQVQQKAIDAGYDGVYALAGGIDNAGEIAVFNPSQVKSADPITYDDKGNVIPLSQRFKPESPDIRYQGEASPLGSITFIDDLNALISVFEKANVTTPIHEAAHFYRRFMLNVENGFTPEEIKAAEDWAGAQNGKWSVEAEEKWARGFERYLRSGESPLPSLAKLFEKMAKWFQGVYKVVAGSPIDVEITPEIKRVFDRMFKLQAERVQAGGQAAPAAVPLNQTQIAANKRDAEYMAAVKAGDTSKAQKMVEEAAKAAGYVSQYAQHTSMSGMPGRFTVFAYGAMPGGLERFKASTAKQRLVLTLEGLSPGWFTTNTEQFADYRADDKSNVYRAFLRFDNPLVLSADEQAQQELLATKRAYIAKSAELQNLRTPAAQYSTKAQKLRKEVEALEKQVRERAKPGGTKVDPLDRLVAMGKEAQQSNPDLLEGAALRESLLKQGYDGIILENTNADTKRTDVTLATWYIPLQGGNQIKSADPVTYDDKGNVIPLSERFKPESPDIRYQKEASPLGSITLKVQASKGPQTLKQEVEGPSGEAQAPVWRSNIIEALGDWKQNKGTPAQLMAHLNKTKGAAEEAKWIGLNEFLQGKPTVTRAQIEDFVSKNPYIVSDTTIKGGIYSGYTLFGGSNYREIILTSPKVPFTSGHFGDVPNYLAHMRVKNFKDSEGRKVLLVEEAQSDLHQKGRKAGYETPETQRKIAALNKQLTALQRQRADVAQDAFDATYKLAQKLTDPQNDISAFNVLVEIQELHARIAQALPRPPLRRQGNTPTVTGKQIADFASGRTPTAGVNVQALAARAGLRKQFNEVLEKLQLRHDLAREIAQAKKSINKIKGDLLPDVPFKGSENWGVMVFKRAIRMAVEEGADVVAWTPGKVQQERYQNLGGDLSTFYDKILPTALGKFVRQWGGKVETIDLTPSLDLKESLRLLVTDELRGQIRYFETRLEEASDEGYDDEGRTTEEILHELNGLNNSLGQAATASDAELNRMLSELPAGPGAAFYEQTPREGFPAIVITPQMKGEAEKGFTLFQAEGVPEDKEGVNYAEIGRKIAERRAEAAKKAKEGQGAAPPQPSTKQQARPSGPTRRPLKVKPPKSLEEMLSDVEKDIQAKAGKASRTSQEEANYRADREVRSLLREYALKTFQGRFGDELELPDGTKVSRRAELLSAIAELQAILKDPALRQNQRLIDRAKVYRRIDYALLAPPKVSKKINPSLRNKLTGHAWGEWSPRSPLSYAQYIGSYERLAGATGRDVSDTFNLVRTMFARGQYRNFAGAMSDLRLRLRPLKDQLREQGYHGLPALIDAHVERLEDATRNIGELTWANVKKAWDENPVNLVSTLAKAFIFNAKLRFSIKSIGLNFIQPLSTLYPYFTASELADLYKRSLTKSEIERVRAIAIAESGGRFTQEMREGVKSRLPNPFQRSSEQVRIMGHLAGEMLADRDKMPPGIERDMFIRSWAEKAEFDNSPWNIGPLFSGPIASVLLQFKPFMFKNLERFATDIRPQKTDKSWITARQAKVILTQLGIGGMSSLMTLVPVVGTALIGPGMLALLAKSLGAMADDDELGEQLAEAFYYGAPSLFGVDLSSSVEFISEPMGKTAAEQVLNVIGGPLVATSVSAYTQGKDMVSLAMRPQKVGEKEEVDKKLREKALRLSKSITPLAGMAEAAAGLATGNRPTMFLNEKEPYTTGETARKMFGFTPLRQTIYYDRKESPGFIQKFAGRQPDVPGITREKGETDATYRIRVQRVEEYRKKYGDQLLAHPRYKTLDEETKQKALEIINGNISTESAKKRPDVRNLNPLYVMRRAKESIRQAPRREKKQLYVPPDED